MGYHSNEETTKKAIKDACRFINDRERYKQALIMILDSMGFSQEDRDQLISDIRQANFEILEDFLNGSHMQGLQ